MIRTRRIWLAIPSIALFACDVALTLGGQSPEYWSGDYHRVVEGNPIAKPILAHSPWLFLGLSIAWAIFLFVVIVFWNHRFANGVAIVVAIGHSLGVGSWILNSSLGWIGVVLVLAVASELSSRCWRRADPNAE